MIFFEYPVLSTLMRIASFPLFKHSDEGKHTCISEHMHSFIFVDEFQSFDEELGIRCLKQWKDNCDKLGENYDFISSSYTIDFGKRVRVYLNE